MAEDGADSNPRARIARALDRIRNGTSAFVNRITRPDRWLSSRFSERINTLAGVPITADTAMSVSAFYAGARYLSQTVGNISWRVKRYTTGGGSEIADRHPVDYLLFRRPNPEWSSLQFRETLVQWAIRWGNGYAEIERDDRGLPVALWPIHPETVTPVRSPNAPYALTYEVSTNGSKVVLAARDVFHIRGYGDNEVGLSVIQFASESIGRAKAIQLFGAAFFGNGMQPSGVVVNKKPLKPDGLQRQKDEWAETHVGVRNKLKTFFLDNDATFIPTTVNARDSQLTEIEAHMVTEIARWIGVPPHKIMDLSRAHFANIEHQSIEVVVDSISPWVTRFQDEADYKLFGAQNRQGFWTEMDLKDLLKGDQKATMEYRRGMVMIGALSPNEIREEDGRNKIKHGDLYVMQGQMVTLEQIEDGKQSALPTSMPDPNAEPPADPAADPNAEPSDLVYDPLDMSMADMIFATAEETVANVK